MQGAACTAKVVVHPDTIDSKWDLLPHNARVSSAAERSQLLTRAPSAASQQAHPALWMLQALLLAVRLSAAWNKPLLLEGRHESTCWCYLLTQAL